jgi:hypothetical protein
MAGLGTANVDLVTVGILIILIRGRRRARVR